MSSNVPLDGTRSMVWAEVATDTNVFQLWHRSGTLTGKHCFLSCRWLRHGRTCSARARPSSLSRGADAGWAKRVRLC